jgi:hypothetical protein
LVLRGRQVPLQQSLSLWQGSPDHPHCAVGPAVDFFASPKQASAMPARPIPNFFSAARRVADWAMFFVNSSNWWFILFLLFGCFLFGQFFPESANP